MIFNAHFIATSENLTMILVRVLLPSDTEHRASLTTYFALVASSGIDLVWGPAQTITVEVYPTVAR